MLAVPPQLKKTVIKKLTLKTKCHDKMTVKMGKWLLYIDAELK